MRLEDPMHINSASVYCKRRKAVRGIRLSMKFIQVASNFVRKDCKLLVITQDASTTVQDSFPIKSSEALGLIIFSARAA